MRGTLYALLGVVAVAAAVLSFTTLRDLALLCGFTPDTAWLLPLVVDVGAGAGTVVWLARGDAPSARTYGRALALTLLGLSVAGNALGHGLAAAGIARPHWLIVVLVSAVAPAVLGAVVHLAVLAGRATADEPTGAADLEVRIEPDAPAVEPDRSADYEPGPDRSGELTAEDELALIESLAVAHAGGEKLPSNRAVCGEHGVGRERAARILRSAADRSVWVRRQRVGTGS